MYLVWKLVLDGRVPWFVKLVLIAPLVFLATPIARIPFVGLAGFVVMVLLAMRIFVGLAPRDVVEGKYHVVEEDDAEK